MIQEAKLRKTAEVAEKNLPGKLCWPCDRPLSVESDAKVVDFQGTTNDTFLESAWDKSLWDSEKDYPPPDYLACINGISCFPRGNLVAVTGQSGNGKSTFLAMLMGALQKGTYAGISCLKERPPRILYFDGEMDISDTDRMCRIVEGIANKQDIPEFYASNLWESGYGEKSYTERRDLLTFGIRKVRPDLLIIDGLAELIENGDVNNLSTSEDLKKWLRSKTHFYRMCTICVLHENPGSDKMRGNLGTVLIQACENEYKVQKDDKVFTVTTKKQRHGKVELKFTLNGELIPCLLGEENTPPLPKPPKKNYDPAIFCQLFSEKERLRHNELRDAYAEASGLSSRSATRHIKEATERKFLLKTVVENEDNDLYELNPLY